MTRFHTGEVANIVGSAAQYDPLKVGWKASVLDPPKDVLSFITSYSEVQILFEVRLKKGENRGARETFKI